MAEGKNRRETIFGYFWIHFGSLPKNVHFALCAPPILKHEIQTSKFGFVTIMLSKRIFCLKKL
jgi:hypothetical protein